MEACFVREKYFKILISKDSSSIKFVQSNLLEHKTVTNYKEHRL